MLDSTNDRESNVKNLHFVLGGVALAFAALFALPASAASAPDKAPCKEGSNSHAGKGNCGHHGGPGKEPDPAASARVSASVSASPEAASASAAASAGKISARGEVHGTIPVVPEPPASAF